MKKVAEISKETYHTKVKPDLSKRQEVVLNVFKVYKELTSKDVALVLEVPLNTISGRFSELEGMNKIEKTGHKNKGCNVYRLVEELVDDNGQMRLI